MLTSPKRYLLFVCLLLAQLFAFSQKEEANDSIAFSGFKDPKLPGHYNVIKFNPIPLVMGQMFLAVPASGELRINYERMITHNQSITIGGSLIFPGPLWAVARSLDTTATFKRFNYIGGRATFGYRFYPAKKMKAPEGFFFGPMFSYSFVKITDKQSKDWNGVHRFNASLIAGYQVLVAKNFYIETVIGLGYQRYWMQEYDSFRDRKRSYPLTAKGQHSFVFIPVHPVLFFNLGYAF
jgi:hypothetical protein